jgi:D-alanyl-D-alanine carboxypeptidase/D-alanyl-D-alanine-endopeptidase (penicillin-binding protein 4)
LRGESEALKDRIYMKSGSMGGVRCYSGYVLPTSGEKKDIIIFSVMTNNVTAPTPKVLQVMDKIIALVASGN